MDERSEALTRKNKYSRHLNANIRIALLASLRSIIFSENIAENKSVL